MSGFLRCGPGAPAYSTWTGCWRHEATVGWVRVDWWLKERLQRVWLAAGRSPVWGQGRPLAHTFYSRPSWCATLGEGGGAAAGVWQGPDPSSGRRGNAKAVKPEGFPAASSPWRRPATLAAAGLGGKGHPTKADCRRRWRTGETVGLHTADSGARPCSPDAVEQGARLTWYAATTAAQYSTSSWWHSGRRRIALTRGRAPPLSRYNPSVGGTPPTQLTSRASGCQTRLPRRGATE